MSIDKTTKKSITWLSWGHFVNDTYTGFVNPIMPYIAASLGITMAMATLVLSISNIFSSLLQPIFGFFADNMLKRAFVFCRKVDHSKYKQGEKQNKSDFPNRHINISVLPKGIFISF